MTVQRRAFILLAHEPDGRCRAGARAFFLLSAQTLKITLDDLIGHFKHFGALTICDGRRTAMAR